MTNNDLFCTPEQGKRLKELVPELTSMFVWYLFKEGYKPMQRYYLSNHDILEPALTLQELRDMMERWNTAHLEDEFRLMMNASEIVKFEDNVIGSTAPELAEWVIKKIGEYKDE